MKTQKTKVQTRQQAARARKHGSKWVRREKRLAIYLRDGCACVWCGAAVEDGARLTLDHIRPVALGGDNEASNLVTACHRCNSSRGKRSVPVFARAVAEYLNHGVTADEIVRHVRRTVRRTINVRAARELIARRGSVAAAILARQ